jgi:hypothetical protein
MVFPVAWVRWSSNGAQSSEKNSLTMAEEEFDENNVWFGPEFRFSESQGLELIADSPPGDDIAKVIAAVGGESSPHSSSKEGDVPTPLPTALPTAKSTTVTRPLDPVEDPEENDPEMCLKPKAKRNT